MKIAYFDCFSGIAGDMALGALLDCGVPVEAVREGLSSLPVSGWHLDAQPVLKSGIHALNVRITLDGQSDDEELAHAQAHHEHSHEHEHDHEREHHDHSHAHHAHQHSHAHHHGRSMAEIRELITQSTLSARVQEMSLAVFWRIAEVEAKMHHSTPEEIHFHEIGGVDSLIDICGVAWCLEYLGIEEVHCSPLPHSSGFVDCAHGRMPIPAPATQELLIGVPMIPTDIKGELVTPTGAGIVAALSQSFGAMPALTPQRVGFGAGKKEWHDRPNMLRVVIGESIESAPQMSLDAAAIPTTMSDYDAMAMQKQSTLNAGLEWRELSVVESNIDDMNPEFFALVWERLFAAGALDVWLQPLQMKKNRPAWRLGVLCASGQQNAIVAALLRETTTLGVRVQTVQRGAMRRQGRSVETIHGAIRVKIARWDENNLWRATPEADDVERVAREHSLPAHEIYQAALEAANLLKPKAAKVEAADKGE